MVTKLKHILTVVFSRNYVIVTDKGNYVQTEQDANLRKDERVKILQASIRNMQAAVKRIESKKSRTINFIETGIGRHGANA